MDAHDSRLLAARIRAGVRIGGRIELEQDLDDSMLRDGDRGVVREILLTGEILVAWEDGTTREIDPGTIAFRRLAW